MKKTMLVLLLVGLPSLKLMAEVATLNFSERIQIRTFPNNSKMILFEYCKLNRCRQIGKRAYRPDEIGDFQGCPSGLKTGIGCQIMTDAGPNNFEDSKFKESVGGVYAERDRFAICVNSSILEKLKGKSKSEDFYLKINVDNCSRSQRKASDSIKADAVTIENILSGLDKNPNSGALDPGE